MKYSICFTDIKTNAVVERFESDVQYRVGEKISFPKGQIYEIKEIIHELPTKYNNFITIVGKRI